jgi:hypothetical protein
MAPHRDLTRCTQIVGHVGAGFKPGFKPARLAARTAPGVIRAHFGRLFARKPHGPHLLSQGGFETRFETRRNENFDLRAD